jgi:hypothetical protein
MLPRVTLVIVVLTVLCVPGVAEHRTPQVDDDPQRIDWVADRTCQVVFQAVLEGLYTDGVSNDIVDCILGVDARSKKLGFDAHFVYCCPLCHPAYEAFRLYRLRPDFYGRKQQLDTFGPGLEPSLRRQLLSEKPTERLEALHKLIKR